jgi:polar amino acid transport system permease protein
VHTDAFLALSANFDLGFFFELVFKPNSAWISGLVITIYASIIAQILGVLLGILSALGGMSRNPLFRAISGLYIWFFRGTPVLVQMALLYFGTPVLLGIDLFPTEIHSFIDIRGAIVAGILALGVNEGAYMSEIVRAGILSVDAGQTEAAKSLGMTYGLTMRRIVLPQALRVIVPPLGNEFNNMLKTTSLMSIIAVGELFRAAQSIASATFRPFEPYLAACVYYLVLTTIWSVVQGWIERRAGAGFAREERPGIVERLFGMRRARAEPPVVGSGGH